jgi:TolA-binding protein
MKQGGCDRLWEVDALREGRLGDKDAASFQRHTATCAECRQRLAKDEHLRELALALPIAEPTELELRRLRSRVLSDVATGAMPRPPQRWPLLAFLTVLVVAGSGGWLLLSRRSPPLVATPALPARATDTPIVSAPSTPQSLAGSVTPIAPARWTQLREDSTERVTLDDGAIRVHVRPQQPGERFLVVLPDGELEVRGTTFDVSVTHGATTQIHVDEGIVELRLTDVRPVRLESGATWAAPPPTGPVAAAQTPSPAPAPRPSAGRSLAPATPQDGAQAYANAVRLLQDGRAEDAASAFHALVLASPHTQEAEDASYLEAVALARMGRGDAAALAAEHHLASFPGSFHRKEASMLVARAAVKRGDCERARAVLASWRGATGDADAHAALGACDDGK